MRQFLKSGKVIVLSNPSYPPDLAPCDIPFSKSLVVVVIGLRCYKMAWYLFREDNCLATATILSRCSPMQLFPFLQTLKSSYLIIVTIPDKPFGQPLVNALGVYLNRCTVAHFRNFLNCGEFFADMLCSFHYLSRILLRFRTTHISYRNTCGYIKFKT